MVAVDARSLEGNSYGFLCALWSNSCRERRILCRLRQTSEQSCGKRGRTISSVSRYFGPDTRTGGSDCGIGPHA